MSAVARASDGAERGQGRVRRGRARRTGQGLGQGLEGGRHRRTGIASVIFKNHIATRQNTMQC